MRDHATLAVKVSDNLEKLEASLRDRVTFWRKKVRACEMNANMEFDRCLSHRGLAGKLIFNHDAEKLDAEVSTSSQDVNAHTSRSLKTLSGGEQQLLPLPLQVSRPARGEGRVAAAHSSLFCGGLVMLFYLLCCERSVHGACSRRVRVCWLRNK